MEFPHIGEHCGWKQCNRLDFLPVKCGACQQIFCTDHFPYSAHSCPEQHRFNHQVPECPLCGVPIPVKAGELPDMKVGRHIDTDCRSQPAMDLKGKVFTNLCSMDKCKKKELVPFICERCGDNFCIRHRNELDHDCKGPSGRRLSKAGASAIFRAVFKNSLSSSSQSPNSSSAAAKRKQEEDDRRMAQRLAASYAAERRQNNRSQQSRNQYENNTSEDNCVVQ